MKKARFHSEFHTRVTLNLKAPEGNDPRAVQMQALIREFSFQVSMGMQNEWVIQAMLDRVAREMNAGIGAGAGGSAGAGSSAMRLPVPSQASDTAEVTTQGLKQDEREVLQPRVEESEPASGFNPYLGTADSKAEVEQEEEDKTPPPPPPRQEKPRGLMNVM